MARYRWWKRGGCSLLIGVVLLALAGCGEGEGVADDAVVAVYVAAPLCAEAKDELAAKRGRAGDVKVRVACLGPAEKGEFIDLAQIGTNARRATEDSASVAYIERRGPIVEFSRPVVEAAGIAYLAARPQEGAMDRVIAAVEEAGGERADVAEALEP